MILALDTTSEWGSIALVDNQRAIEEVAMDSPDGFAHVLFGEIETLLARHGLKIEDVELFASASGPGSFTGVRVGLTAAKGLAEAAGRKVAAVSNLRAVASFAAGRRRAAMIDARRGQIYGGVYDETLEPISEEVVIEMDAWLAMLPADVEIVASHAMRGDPNWKQAPRSLAAAIGKIAAAHPDLARDPAEIDANYVRRSDAELFWRD